MYWHLVVDGLCFVPRLCWAKCWPVCRSRRRRIETTQWSCPKHEHAHSSTGPHDTEVPEEIKDSGLSDRQAAKVFNIMRSTAPKWLKRDDVQDRSHRAHLAYDLLVVKDYVPSFVHIDIAVSDCRNSPLCGSRCAASVVVDGGQGSKPSKLFKKLNCPAIDRGPILSLPDCDFAICTEQVSLAIPDRQPAILN